MNEIILSFYGELLPLVCLKNRHLNREKGIISLNYPLSRRASIKDIVESLGVPHTEVGLLSMGKRKIDFVYIPRGGERIEVYPHPIPYSFHNYLFNENPAEVKFVADVNIGKLARLLRMLGFDCAYNWRWDDDKISKIACQEKRIVLTRDIDLLKRKNIVWGRFVRAIDPREQLIEIMRCFGLAPPFNFFSRCLECNTPLIPVEKKDILYRLEPKTKKYYNVFSLCPVCNKIYWRGSHFEKMRDYLKRIIENRR